jgi:uncharacterized membrane protein
MIAGIFGAATLTQTPLLIQTVPGAIAYHRQDEQN